ncbi:MAG: AAA family ATPase [Candidatus Lindowbacteria bacterium]|nr:AAA family ATPase [Candidatus Lindowbacteria bacterium]
MALAATQFGQKITANIEKVIVGKRGAVSLLAVAALCDGQVLIEDVPGVAKTMLVNALAISLGCKFTRIHADQSTVWRLHLSMSECTPCDYI